MTLMAITTSVTTLIVFPIRRKRRGCERQYRNE